MPSSVIIRPAGKTVCLSVVATSHAAVSIVVDGNDTANFVAVTNPGSLAVAVRISQQGVAATLPVDGTPGDYLLPPLMEAPILLPLPNAQTASAQITAIATAAGPTLIYATPIIIQS